MVHGICEAYLAGTVAPAAWKSGSRFSAGAKSSRILFGLMATLLLASTGCHREEPLAGAKELDHATCDFAIYWPPADPEKASPQSLKPLLKGTLALDAKAQPSGGTVVRLVVTLRRPSAEADRQHWNSVLAYDDIAWMSKVRVWDAEEKWLWPNLPYLLRLPGQERVERYGGMDQRRARASTGLNGLSGRLVLIGRRPRSVCPI